jgi:hypothetical protein
MEPPVSTYGGTDFNLLGTNFILWGKPHGMRRRRSRILTTTACAAAGHAAVAEAATGHGSPAGGAAWEKSR